MHPDARDHLRFHELALPGCFEITFCVHSDRRGSFVKTFQASAFAQAHLNPEILETFYTVSEAGVLRGMHFQAPPADHVKTIYCVAGRVLDVALDVRVGSPAYGRHVAVELSAQTANAVYLERGIAHGFYVLDGPATLVYAVSSEHDSVLDIGVAWNSFGMRWPDPDPVLSDRDAALPPLHSFSSPFNNVRG